MRPLALALLLALAPLAQADEPAKLPASAVRAQRAYETALERLEKQYQAERKRIDDLYRQQLSSLRADLVTELEAAKVAAATRVDLAGANAIAELVANVPKTAEVPGVGAGEEQSQPTISLDDVAGTWTVDYSRGRVRDYAMRGDEIAVRRGDDITHTGTLRVNGPTVVADLNDGHSLVFRPSGDGRLIVWWCESADALDRPGWVGLSRIK